jgi:cytochrome c
MDFFKDIVIPPSANHVLLLKYILAIAMLIFLPYLGMLMGSSVISVYFNRRGYRENNKMYLRFAKDIIEKLTIGKNAHYALGILPIISIILAYTQLLYDAPTIAAPLMAFSGLLFIIAFVFIYKFRNTYEIESVISSLKDRANTKTPDKPDTGIEEINEFEENVIRSNSHSGWLGIVFLYCGAYLFAGSTALASNPGRWQEVVDILQIIFSWATIINFLLIIGVSGAVTGVVVLFYFFKWQGGLPRMSREYSLFVNSFASNLALFSSLSLPVLLFLNILYLPREAMSPAFFLYHVLALIAVVLLCNVLYLGIKNSEVKFSVAAVVLVILVLAFTVFQGNIAFGSAISEQTLAATLKAEDLEKELISKNTSTTTIDAQQIYNTKCIACHKFDVKLVGPPYQETVPKYNGDANKLADFIYNPIKKDPAFPPMPNQGLKKNEALAMAKWLIEKAGGKK